MREGKEEGGANWWDLLGGQVVTEVGNVHAVVARVEWIVLVDKLFQFLHPEEVRG